MVLQRRMGEGVVAALALVLIAAGCGGGSSDANEPEASRKFMKSGSKNQIPKFGEEADADEREAASSVLEENLEARAAGEWGKQCSSLTAGAIKQLAEETALRGNTGSCAGNLKLLGEPKPETEAIRENTMTGPVDALRVKGDRGWALYHGAKGKDYAMPMEQVNGVWKVDSLATTELH